MEKTRIGPTLFPQIVIGKTDCLMEKDFCQSEQVRGFPTLIFYRTGLGVNRVEGVRYQGERDAASLDLFIKEVLNIKIDVVQESEDHLNIEEGVYVLTNNTFHDLIAHGDTFVQFCPPWSSACQRLTNTWTSLATSLAKEEVEVRLAEIDCSLYASLCEEEAGSVYPTLLYYRHCLVQ